MFLTIAAANRQFHIIQIALSFQEMTWKQPTSAEMADYLEITRF